SGCAFTYRGSSEACLQLIYPGVATLAILYRYLYRASHRGIRVIGGFLPLLQVWIYESILPLRPWMDPDMLVDKRLNPTLSGLRTITCSYMFVRNPYSPNIFTALPDYYLSGSGVWRVIVGALHQIYTITLTVQDSDNDELRELGVRLSKLALNSFRVVGGQGRVASRHSFLVVMGNQALSDNTSGLVSFKYHDETSVF
ncbi:hypothetical protein HAX54_049605, partial [Datura stramonium]|nr:hypothetical protein [Datura stramonium]